MRRFGWLLVSICLLMSGIFVRNYMGNIGHIPSASMTPNLVEGDYAWVNRWSLLDWHLRVDVSRVHPGDVVSLRDPGNTWVYYVKRVIGVPGDHIRIVNGAVWRNNILLSCGVGHMTVQTAFGPLAVPVRHECLNGHHYNVVDWPGTVQPYADMKEVIIPTGHVFVMGDNRPNSADSRVPVALGGVGILPVTLLDGRVMRVLGSRYDMGRLGLVVP